MHDGLGYLDTSLVNIAMVGNLYWKLKTEPDLWWPQVLHEKYLPQTPRSVDDRSGSQSAQRWAGVIS